MAYKEPNIRLFSRFLYKAIFLALWTKASLCVKSLLLEQSLPSTPNRLKNSLCTNGEPVEPSRMDGWNHSPLTNKSVGQVVPEGRWAKVMGLKEARFELSHHREHPRRLSL